MSRKKQIEKYMLKLKISREEAEQLLLDDEQNIVTEEMAEMEKKAKEIKRYEKSDTPKKKVIREKKIDQDKNDLMTIFYDAIMESQTIDKIRVINTERQIDFMYKGAEYSITLTKHRPPKK